MDAAPYQLEVGPSVAFVRRLAEPQTPRVSAGFAIAPGLMGRAYLLPWLGLSIRYNRALHELSMDPGALGTGAAALEPTEDLKVTTLQAAVQPTWRLTPRALVYASAGLGWASVEVPAIRLPGASLSSVRQRRGVHVEVPFGVGLGWWVVPRWVSLGYEASLAPSFRSTGDAYSPDVFVNAQGQNAVVGAMPAFTFNSYHHLSLTLTL